MALNLTGNLSGTLTGNHLPGNLTGNSKDTFKISGKKLVLNPLGATTQATSGGSSENKKQATGVEEPMKEWKFFRRPGAWVIAQSPDGRRQRLSLSLSRNRFSASVGGTLWFGEWVREDRHSNDQGSAGGESLESDLVAQFPGKVRKIMVQSGALVKEGDPLLLIEAMKMEFSIKAPFSGRINAILVQEGKQISPGDRLVDMEAAGER